MNPKALLALAALVVCFACAQYPTPSAQPPKGGATAAAWPLTGSNCNAQTFAASVLMTSTSYPGPYNPSTDAIQLPSNYLDGTSLNSTIITDLTNAFSLAQTISPSFANQLCNLSGGVFIDQRTCGDPTCSIGQSPINQPSGFSNSWGFRNPGTANGYIGLPIWLWQSTGQVASAPPFYEYESNLLLQVLYNLTEGNTAGNVVWPGTSPTAYSGAPYFPTASGGPNTSSAMTVLAALAHEYGHVLWYLALKSPQNPYAPSQFCNGSYFGNSGNSWQQINTPPTFQQSNYRISGDKQQGTAMSDLIKGISLGDSAAATAALDRLYSDDSGTNQKDGVWPSLFGAVSPEEDFVETFKLYVVSGYNLNDTGNNSGITSMALSTSTQADIYKDLNTQQKKNQLKIKIHCIATAMANLTQPNH